MSLWPQVTYEGNFSLFAIMAKAIMKGIIISCNLSSSLHTKYLKNSHLPSRYGLKCCQIGCPHTMAQLLVLSS